jgi:hypothetical protein
MQLVRKIPQIKITNLFIPSTSFSFKRVRLFHTFTLGESSCPYYRTSWIIPSVSDKECPSANSTNVAKEQQKLLLSECLFIIARFSGCCII